MATTKRRVVVGQMSEAERVYYLPTDGFDSDRLEELAGAVAGIEGVECCYASARDISVHLQAGARWHVGNDRGGAVIVDDDIIHMQIMRLIAAKSYVGATVRNAPVLRHDLARTHLRAAAAA